MKAVITGGGTGGHIYPALAIADRLKKLGWEILYIGSDYRLEADIVPEAGFKFEVIPVMSMPRKISFDILFSLRENSKGLFKSYQLIKKYDADIVIGTGGFVAGPVMLAAYLNNVFTLIHEQNAYPGITNKIASFFSNIICLNFPEAEHHFPRIVRKKIKLTGNPVRQEIIDQTRREGASELGLNEEFKTILIVGGSQGAQSINRASLSIYKYLDKNSDKKLQLVHITGKKNYQSVLKMLKNNKIDIENDCRIKVFSYLSKIENALSSADLIISRAGATGISEITVKGIAAVLIPFPYSAEDHQMYNATALASNGAAVIIEEKDLDGKTLLDKSLEIIENEKKLKYMKKQSEKMAEEKALDKIINIITEKFN
ncbi:MAG: undecaprenyldiphospho-muramoylpentapeptide beta-N-acetylglucosaminyltransferase [Bacillota bacterium]